METGSGKVQKETEGLTKKKKRTAWMTEEILVLMDRRRRFTREETKYREMNKLIRWKIREANK